jgi:hypothetical protein
MIAKMDFFLYNNSSPNTIVRSEYPHDRREEARSYRTEDFRKLEKLEDIGGS